MHTYLCLSYKEKSKIYTKKNNWDTEEILLLLAIQEELGELCARFLAEHPGYEKPLERTHTIPEEIGDLGHLILAFCNKTDLDFEKCVENTISKRKLQHKLSY